MSYFFILILLISLISKKVLSSCFEDCLNKHDCYNCSSVGGCVWENETCVNYNDSSLFNSSNYKSTECNYSLSDPNIKKDDLYQKLKYFRNTCFPDKVANKPEEKYIHNELSDKYCGNNFIILNNNRLINGYKIELKNNSGIYGTPNLLCEYVLNHGQMRIDVDIFINRTLSKDFSLFYSEDLLNNIYIDYSTTLTVYSIDYNSVSFFYYSNKTFETSPFIIYFKVYDVIEEEEGNNVLTYLFLAAMIGFVALTIIGIIIMRKYSLFFKLKKIEIKNNINNRNKELSIISEKNIEENSRNEMEIDIRELKQIKSNTIDSYKKNEISEGTK